MTDKILTLAYRVAHSLCGSWAFLFELEKTVIGRSRIDCISLANDVDIDLWPWPSIPCVITYSHAKDQGQRSVDKVETHGRMDRRTKAITLPPWLMRSVIILVDISSCALAFMTSYEIIISSLTRKFNYVIRTVFLPTATVEGIVHSIATSLWCPQLFTPQPGW